MINEILLSLQAEPEAWTVLKASTTSETLRNSPEITEVWSEMLSDIDEVTLLYRDSDGSCVVFRYISGHFTAIPALLTLKLNLVVTEHINDIDVLYDLEDFVAYRHTATPNFWRLK